MTFIASVIAKEGIALVADSFRTTIEHSIDEDTFLTYIGTAKNKTRIPIKELVPLFDERASHTRNYVDKLFQFDGDSAISSTGAAYINKKEIKDIIQNISALMQADTAAYNAKTIDEKLNEFNDKIKVEIVEHLKSVKIGDTDFIFSHFNRSLNKPQVFIIKIRKREKDDITETVDRQIISWEEQTHLGIISDGQDTFVDRLIFGSLYTNMTKMKRQIIDYIVTKCKPKKAKKAEIIQEINDFDFLKDTVLKDFFSIKFRELSLQEAVDLAALLIKIVMDIQVYTEKIPTVGGLIRLAVISKSKGFEWISGDKIIPPKII